MTTLSSKVDLLKTIDAVLSIEKVDSSLNEDLSAINFSTDEKGNYIVNVELYKKLTKFSELKEFLHEPESIPIKLFICLYIKTNCEQYFKEKEGFQEVQNILKDINFFKTSPYLHDYFIKTSLAYFLRKTQTRWKDFTKNFTGEDWTDINLLAELLSFANISIEELKSWISIVVLKQEQDGALRMLGKEIYDCILLSDIAKPLEARIVDFLQDKHCLKFTASLLKGIFEKNGNNYNHYFDLLRPYISIDNGYNILYGLGIISIGEEEGRDFFWSEIITHRKNNHLSTSDFILLCASFHYYREEVQNIILHEVVLNNPEELYAVCEYLSDLPKEKILEHYTELLESIYTRSSEPTFSLQMLFNKIAELDNEYAYYLLKKRLSSLGQKGLLVESITKLANSNKLLFQSNILEWFNSDIRNIHTSIQYIISKCRLPNDYYNIPQSIYSSLPTKDLQYVAYKIVGYIYSMEALQSLLLSLIKSVTNDSKRLKPILTYLLGEYLIYNYRSTLDILEKEINEPNINPFAKELFEYAVKAYEQYFANLKSISAKNELSPNQELVKISNFYKQKYFSKATNTEKHNSLLSLFKKTRVNAHKWAVRRDGQAAHEVIPLTHHTVNAEYPAGELLDPYHQEYIRRTYQTLKRR